MDPQGHELEALVEELMVGARRLSRPAFSRLAAGLAPRALIWGIFGVEHPLTSFTLDEAGQPIDLEGRALELPADAQIGLLHPLELELPVRRAWSASLARRGVAQPFAQLRRARLRLAAWERDSPTLARFAGRPTRPPQTLAVGGRWSEWSGPAGEGEGAAKKEGAVERRGYVLELARAGQRLRAVAVYREGTILEVFNDLPGSFGALAPVLLSELLCELEALATAPYAALELELESWGHTHGECLVCRGPLEPDTLALGLLRPHAGGEKHRAWTHWACIEDLPELQLAAHSEDVRGHLRALRDAHARSPAPASDPQKAPSEATPGEATPSESPRSESPPSKLAPSIGLDEDSVLALCPDVKAATASKKIAKRRSWTSLGRLGELAWGECLGSHRYCVAVDLRRAQVRCTCPSRKRPCKHGVALMLLHARAQLDPGEPPGWAQEHFPDIAVI